MTKNERVAKLEDKVRLLDKQLDAVCVAYDDLRARVVMRLDALEARPIVLSRPAAPWYRLPDDHTAWPRCTCGSTAGCPVHGGNICGSWDGSTLDADGHVQ